MQNQLNFQRFGHGQSIDSGDQGTWQPIQMQKQTQAQEDTYFTGVCSQANATYYTTQQTVGGNGSGSGPSSGATNFKNIGCKGPPSGGIGPNQSQYLQGDMRDRSGGNGNLNMIDDGDRGYYGLPNDSYMTSAGGNTVGMNTPSTGDGNMMGGMNSEGNMNSNCEGTMMDVNARSGRNRMGMQTGDGGNMMGMNAGGGGNMMDMNAGGGGNMMVMNSGGGGNMMGMNSGGGGNMMDMNSSGGGNMMGMNSVGGGNVMDMTSGGGGNVIGPGMRSGRGRNMMGNSPGNVRGGSLMNPGNATMSARNNSRNSVGMRDNGNHMIGRNFMPHDNMPMNDNNMAMDSGAIANQFQKHLMAAVGMGRENWQNNPSGNNGGYNDSGSFPGRGRRGRGVNRFKGPDMFYQSSGPTMERPQFGPQRGGGRQNFHVGGEDQLTVNLSASNYNYWCFLRKKFNKRNNDLAEHLFDIHEKFCHHCKDRIEEKKYGKRKKIADEPSPAQPVPVEEPEEELTEEELEIKKLMGFAGFKSTKGSRVKDNSYNSVSAVNRKRSEEAEDQTSALTGEEKRMIASIGGFSVFSKGDTSSTSKPGFGAPAVNFEPVEDSGPGCSNESLDDKKMKRKDSKDHKETKTGESAIQKQHEENKETWR